MKWLMKKLVGVPTVLAGLALSGYLLVKGCTDYVDLKTQKILRDNKVSSAPAPAPTAPPGIVVPPSQNGTQQQTTPPATDEQKQKQTEEMLKRETHKIIGYGKAITEAIKEEFSGSSNGGSSDSRADGTGYPCSDKHPENCEPLKGNPYAPSQ